MTTGEKESIQVAAYVQAVATMHFLGTGLGREAQEALQAYGVGSREYAESCGCEECDLDELASVWQTMESEAEHER